MSRVDESAARPSENQPNRSESPDTVPATKEGTLEALTKLKRYFPGQIEGSP
ncbi:hypothetical protein PGTUg99_030255 [Puccinia graminis f. sp. tritici]|uniref:Uncharacterized protein n=1 Tax=Puccinia graminis f. sp. tritici TaxID=56615 RepID=A0A5B0MD73_PUCGR|nr:hypothetical protein PGTUg99_030255 [Puccinia graminis f. sp. tritici]